MTLLLLCFSDDSVKIIIDNINAYCNIYYRREVKMKESVYKSYDDLPLFLNAETIAKLLGISISSSYELMHEKNFPSLKIGSRLLVSKEKFSEWIDKKTVGNLWNIIIKGNSLRIILCYRMRSLIWNCAAARLRFMFICYTVKTEKHLPVIQVIKQ